MVLIENPCHLIQETKSKWMRCYTEVKQEAIEEILWYNTALHRIYNFFEIEEDRESFFFPLKYDK